MIRRPHLKTYERKKTTSFCHSQSSLWEPQSFSKRISPNEKKNKFQPLQYDKDIEELSSGYLENTFDRIAKDVRILPLQQQVSNTSINTSSDAPLNEVSPTKNEIHQNLWSVEPTAKTRASKRAKRKPVQSRTIYAENEVVVKKRLKNNLIDLSITKDNASRYSRRKVSNKTSKNVAESKKRQDTHAQSLSINESADWFTLPVKSNKITENQRKEKNQYISRRKKTVETILDSLSSTDTDRDRKHNSNVKKVKAKKKKKNTVGKRKAGKEKVELCNSMVLPLKELDHISNCPIKDVEKLQEITNENSFATDSVNTEKISFLSNETGRQTVNQDSSGLQSASNFQKYSPSVLGINNDHDPAVFTKCNRLNLNNSDASVNDVANKKNFSTIPCSVLLLKCDENIYPIKSREKPAVLLQNSESSALNTAPNSDKEECDAAKVNDNSNLDIEPSKVKVVKKNFRRKSQIQSSQSVHHQKCSTPINAYMKIDKTINCLSPIIATDKTFHKNRKLLDRKEIQKISLINYSETNSSSEYSDLPKTTGCRKGTKQKFGISYEGKLPFDMKDEDCKENEIDEVPIENIGNCENFSHCDNAKHTESPTSQIQESLEILKIDNSDNQYNTDDKSKLRFTAKNIVLIKGNGSNKTFESSKEFTGQSKDGCSQLTPTGIITTRSKRQLKLSMTIQKKFFNDSSDSKIDPDTENNVINNFVNFKKRNPKVCFKHNSVEYAQRFNLSENNCTKIKPALNISTAQISKNSTTEESRNQNASREFKTMSLHKASMQHYRRSLSEDNRPNTRMSVMVNPQNKYATLSSEEYSQSLIEPTEYLDSLNVKSHDNVESEAIIINDNNSDSEWSTLSSSVNSNLSTSNVDEKINVTSEAIMINDNSSGSKWSTLSSSANSNLSTSNVDEKINQESYEKSPLYYSSDSSGSNKNEIDNDPSKKLSNSLKCSPDLSLEDAEIVLAERMKLLSTRINTRKRRKTFMKPVTESISQIFVDELHTSDNSKLQYSVDVCARNESDSEEEKEIGNVAHSLVEPADSPRRNPLFVKLNTNLQPLVLLEKLKDPLKFTANHGQSLDVRETAGDIISTKSGRIISKKSNESFITNNTKLPDEYNDGLRKSDSLSCSPDKTQIGKSNLSLRVNESLSNKYETRNSSLKTNVTSASTTTSSGLNINVSNLEIIDKQSVSGPACQIIITRSKNENLSSEVNQPQARRSQIKNLSLTDKATFISTANCSGSNLDVSNPELIGKQSLFLKPGKEWARSLSILNNIQNGSNLEELSTGKGKNWRKSVRNILAMQQEGLVQSCLGKNENDGDRKTRFKALNCTTIPDATSYSEEQSNKSASPSRFIKRMSIRVIPDNRRLSKIVDTSFLEAYGITANKSRKTLLFKSPELKSGRKTIINDEQCEDATNETIENERIVTARDVVLQRCDQDNYLAFTKCFPAQYLEHCRKIGEGVYGEVFLYEYQEQKSVIKIIPIEGETLVNGERQKRFDEILSEIVIAKELHDLRNGERYQTHGFVEVKNIKCIRGKYPVKLIELWNAYDNDKGSDNDCPSMFDRNQLYIVLELGHGGEDLEAFVFRSSIEAHALLVQTAVALAVAEQSLEFEHRDLHWGNVLISETKDSEVTYKLDNKEYTYPTKGLQVAIIDFTLSRMSYDGCCIFNDLALDPALFTAQGEYQFEVYRLMRDKIGNNWQQFEPYTNILWLHYTIDKMITSLRYKRKPARGHKEGLYALHELKNIVLNYQSAYDFVTNCEQITNLQCTSTSETTRKPIK